MLINYLCVDIQPLQPRLINKDENDGYPKRARVLAQKDAREREGEMGGGGGEERVALDKKAEKISDAPD